MRKIFFSLMALALSVVGGGSSAFAQATVDVDKTALVKTDQGSWGGKGEYNYTVTTSDGRSVKMIEHYEEQPSSQPDITLKQVVTGLEDGEYTVSIYAKTNCANWNYTIDPAFVDGSYDYVHLYALSDAVKKTVQIEADGARNYNRALKSYDLDITVKDGTLEIGMEYDTKYTNWNTIQIKSLIWHTTTAQLLASEIAALNDKITEAKAIENPSEELLAAIAAAESVLETATTAEELQAAIAALTKAIAMDAKVRLVAGATPFAPVETDFVVNGTFDTKGVTAPWKTTTGAQNQTTANNQQGAFTGNFFENWNPSAFAGKMYQTVSEIPNGTYKLSICAFVNTLADPTNCQYVYANDDKTYLTTGAPTAYEVYTVVTDNNIEVGFEQTSAVANWCGIDNVKLYYYGKGDVKNAAINAGAIMAVSNVYNDVLAKVNALDADGKAKFAELTAAIKTAIDNGTVTPEQQETYIAEINAAYIAAIKAQTTPGLDWTEVIVNPSFEDNFTGWTNTGMAAQGNTSFGKTGSKYAEKWEPNGTFGVEQTITDLPEAVYTITVRAKARLMTSASLYAGDSSTAMTIDDNEREYSLTLATGGNLTFGATGVGTGAGTSWFCLDNFRLTYVGSVNDYLDNAIAAATVDTTQPMYSVTKTAYESALAAATTARTSGTAAEKYAAAQALEAAIAAANASIAAYANVKTLTDELATTNIYSAETASNIATLKASYEAATLTDDDANAIKLGGGWHAANSYDDYILPAWKIGGEQCNEYDKALYLNTWSTEGNTDGSDVKAPFFEYWVSDANVLGATTITATQAGLVAGKMYQVSALVRVHATTGQSAARNGITLQVGDGKAVDVCNGAALDNNYNFGTYTAVGAADENGVLTIKFNVNEGSNVSWLAYKHVNYAEAVKADVEALNTAIAAAEAKALGFEAGEFAPYNNTAALEALAAAKGANGYEPQAEIEALTAALTGATWTANTEEVNAIYDGTFSEHAYAETGTNEQAFAWTGDEGHNSAYNVRHMYGSETNAGLTAASSGEAMMIKFGASYGKVEGYTMPLKANTLYTLTFVFGGWGNGSGDVRNVGKGITVTTPNGETIELNPNAIYAVDKGNSDASTWNTYAGAFKTAEAGNYVLNFVHRDAANQQDQYVISDLNLVKGGYEATMNITDVQWGTFVAPYAVAIPEGVTASTVAVVENVINRTELEGTIPANTPVLVKSESPVTKAFYGVATADETCTVDNLTGVFVETTVPQGAYVLQNGSAGLGFYRVASDDIKAGASRAYLTVPAGASAPRYFLLDGEATGIQNVEATSKSDAIYDITGRRVNNANGHGIYIINGKKIIK